eukprot:jgi/Chlat1/4838/Chrsp31S00373
MGGFEDMGFFGSRTKKRKLAAGSEDSRSVHQNARLQDNISFALFDPEWVAEEELLLLEGVEMYGMGNWGEVAEHVATKSKQACMDHYFEFYLSSPTAPLPDFSIQVAKRGPDAEPTKAKTQSSDSYEKSSEGDERPSASIPLAAAEDDATQRNQQPEQPQHAAKGLQGKGLGDKQLQHQQHEEQERHKEEERVMEEETGEPKPLDAQTSQRTIGQKKPKPVAAAASGGEGKQADSNKTGLGTGAGKNVAAGVNTNNAPELTGYNAKRNEFDPEYDNEAEVPLADMEFKDTDIETDRNLKLRMLEVYNMRLDERMRRKAFVIERGLLNVKKQQAAERKRSKDERDLHARMRVFARFHSQAEHEALLAGLVEERRLRQRIEELKEYRSMGIRTLAEAEVYAMEKRRRETEVGMRKMRDNGAHKLGGSNLAPALANANVNANSNAVNNGIVSNNNNNRTSRYLNRDDGTLLMPPSTATTPRELQVLKKQGMLDVTGMPGVELLSLKEKDVCVTSRVLPVQYLAIKEKFMCESVTRGSIGREDALAMFPAIDAAKTGRVYDLLLASGWIAAGLEHDNTGGPSTAYQSDNMETAEQAQCVEPKDVGADHGELQPMDNTNSVVMIDAELIGDEHG